MKLSRRALEIKPSLTRKLFNMAQEYDDVIDLTLGDPDLLTNKKIRIAACNAIDMGKTRYSANAGLMILREKIARHVENEYRVSVDPKSEIIVTVGGMEALYLALATIIDEGDEVIVPAPFYVNYVEMIKICGGVPIIIETREENNFSFDIKQIEDAITDKTVAIILNTPSNPTGQVLPDDLLTNLSKVVTDKKLVVISDEVYSSLIYDNQTHHSIFNKNGMKNYTVLIDSCSKRFSMTGYRIGYAVAPKVLAEAMTKMQENVAACAPLPSQYAAIEGYSNCIDDMYIHDEFEKRRDYIYAKINNIEGLYANKPAATFYIFVNISKTGMDSITFAEKLLQTSHVAVVPGITYGEAYDSFVRIAFTMNIEKLEIAMERIADFMKRLEQ